MITSPRNNETGFGGEKQDFIDGFHFFYPLKAEANRSRG